MNWRQATRSIIDAARTAMGEHVEITREGLSLAVSPLTCRAIYECATNVDETGVTGYADLENQKAMADFKISDLKGPPERGDLIHIPASGESFIVFQVVDDGYARYRCLLEDV